MKHRSLYILALLALVANSNAQTAGDEASSPIVEIISVEEADSGASAPVVVEADVVEIIIPSDESIAGESSMPEAANGLELDPAVIGETTVDQADEMAPLDGETIGQEVAGSELEAGVETTNNTAAGYLSVEPPPAPEDLVLELPDDDVVLEMPAIETQSTVSRDAETISVDFPDEEVRTIIRNVADLYDLNVVIPDTLVGSISLKLRNVTWRQVFNVALTPLGFTFVEEGNIIKVMSREELQQEPVDTRVFIINFATAADLRTSIEPLIDTASGGRIQVDVRSNALVITERPSRMSNIIEIIERLDRPTEQVMIESKFVEVAARNLSDLGVNWSSLRGFNMQGNVSRSITEGYESSSGRNNQRQQGSNYSRAPGSTQGEVTIINEDLVTETVSRLDSLIREDTAVFDTDTFNVLVSALDQTDDIELISNPTVVTMNNTPAAIHIGDQYPVPQFTYNEERGTFEVSGFEMVDLGIKLNVLPQVNTAGFITMAIKPEISSRNGGVQFGGAAGTEIPIVTRRTTESTVTIKSGYTLAIGGLVERNSTVVETKVPVLGDIPIMGRLFRHDSDSTDERNLIVFITAKVLNADGSTYRDVFSQRRLYEMGIKTRDLPGYEPPAEEKELFESLQQARDELEQLKAEAQLRAQLESLQRARMDREREAAKKQQKSQ